MIRYDVEFFSEPRDEWVGYFLFEGNDEGRKGALSVFDAMKQAPDFVAWRVVRVTDGNKYNEVIAE